jgi:hypothetical protein
MQRSPGSPPTWKIMLSNVKLNAVKLPNDRIRYPKILNGRSFGQRNRELTALAQSHILVYGSPEYHTNRYDKSSIGMDVIGFEVLLSILVETNYKYALIYPNTNEYNRAFHQNIISSQRSNEDFYISNSSNIKRNTPIKNLSLEVFF